ncbi:hypothetical protein N9T94_00565 [bacterium]|nr:hypothetical protein [bacterium]
MLKKNISSFVFCFLIIILFKPTWLLNNEDLGVGGDDMSYWLHSATLTYDLDINYVDDYQFSHINYHPETNTPAHPPGSGYATAIFVKIFSFLDSSVNIDDIRNNPVGSYSLLGYMFGSMFFCLMGFYFFNKLIDNKGLIVNKKIIFLLIYCSTLVHFVTNRFVMAHSFEFLLAVLILYNLETKDNLFKTENFLLLVFLYFLLAITRPSTFIYTLCFIGVYINKFELKQNYIWKNFLIILVSGISYYSLAIKLYNENNILINLSSNSTTSGSQKLINLEQIINGISEIPLLFFSSSLGIVWSTPVVFIGIICIFLNKNYFEKYNLFNKFFILLYFVGSFLVLIVWQGMEASFGQRLLIGLLPFCSYQICVYFNKKSTSFLIIFVFISFIGNLYLYSSSNLTLKLGPTLWGTVIDWAAEDYYYFLILEMFNIQNIGSVFSRTIFFIDLVYFTELVENLEVVNILSKERYLNFMQYTKTYNNLSFRYLAILNIIIFLYSFVFEKITRDKKDKPSIK